jgi:hypothetical protein
VTDKILSLFLFQGSLDKTFTTLTFLLRFDIPFTACTLQLNYMDKRKTGKQVLNVMSKTYYRFFVWCEGTRNNNGTLPNTKNKGNALEKRSGSNQCRFGHLIL